MALFPVEAMETALINRTLPLSNPQAPMAYMAASAGNIFRVASYMMIGALGAFIWDIVDNIYDDYKLLFQREMSFATVVYFFSRVIVLVAVIVDTLFWSAPLGLKACQSALIAACVLYHISFSSTALLFFLRVRAVFNSNKYIIAFFAFLWLGVVGGSMAFAFSGVSEVIGPTKYCKPGANHHPGLYIAATPITLLVNDTCVFIAISWRLLSYASWSPTAEGKTAPSLLNLVFGRNLPVFSKAFFQDGQVYYLISVLTNVFSVIITVYPKISLGFGHTYVFSAVIMNMTASKVYRHTKFGKYREHEISTTCVRSPQAGGKQSFASGSQRSLWWDQGKSVDGDARQWHEKLRSRVLLAFILVALVVIPVACASVCTKRRQNEMRAK